MTGDFIYTSIQTKRRVTFDAMELWRLFGSAPNDHVPLTARSAELIFSPGDVVEVRWTCIAPDWIIRHMAPTVLDEDMGLIAPARPRRRWLWPIGVMGWIVALIIFTYLIARSIQWFILAP